MTALRYDVRLVAPTGGRDVVARVADVTIATAVASGYRQSAAANPLAVLAGVTVEVYDRETRSIL